MPWFQLSGDQMNPRASVRRSLLVQTSPRAPPSPRSGSATERSSRSGLTGHGTWPRRSSGLAGPISERAARPANFADRGLGGAEYPNTGRPEYMTRPDRYERSWPRSAWWRFDPPTVAQLHLAQFIRYGEPPPKRDQLSAIGRVHYWAVHSPHILIAVWNSSNQGDQMSPRASDRPMIMRSGHAFLAAYIDPQQFPVGPGWDLLREGGDGSLTWTIAAERCRPNSPCAAPRAAEELPGVSPGERAADRARRAAAIPRVPGRARGRPGGRLGPGWKPTCEKAPMSRASTDRPAPRTGYGNQRVMI